jgi:signal transduction histidine kinase
MNDTSERTILLVSDNTELCEAARNGFAARNGGLRVAAVRTVDAARRILQDAPPAVILLDQASVLPETEGAFGKMPRLESVVSALAVHAHVVVIGDPNQGSEMAALVAAGAADFVERAGGCVPAALQLVERQLELQQNTAARHELPAPGQLPDSEHFGEILRHELNNPLTGILGNAELLLAEVLRKNDGRLPVAGRQRLETIAALAVRLRETVRRLSQECEIRQPPSHHT